MIYSRRHLTTLLATGAALAATACGRVGSAEALAQERVGSKRARLDLYACEGCEAVLEHEGGLLAPAADLARGAEPGERLELRGRVLTADGEEPAANVIIYAHHTDAQGLYTRGAPHTPGDHRHGHLRGWVRTDADGGYRFRTIKPAPYPTLDGPAHIHLMVGEPGRRPYYIDDVVFDGEMGVDAHYRQRQALRGGTGIVRLQSVTGGLLAVRDIRLERHPE